MLSLNLLGGFTYMQEVILNLAYKRMRIEEVPIAVRGEREFVAASEVGFLNIDYRAGNFES